MKTLRLTVDPDSIAMVEEASRCLSRLAELASRAPKLIERFRRLPDRTVCFDLSLVPTIGTGDCRIAIKPCQALLDLTAAVRALERDIDAF